MGMLEGFTQFINIKIAGTSTLGGAVDDAVSAMDRLQKRSKTMIKMGAGMVGAGASVVGAFIPMVIQAGKFATEIARAGALAGAAAEQITKMSETAKYLGATTLFTATQVASGQEALIRLGMTAEQVSVQTGIMAQTLSFATAHQIEMADAGQMLVTTLKSFGAPISKASKLADMFTTIVSRTAFDISSLKESMKAANAGIPAMNQSIATQITLLGLLADRGQKGSMGGTRLARAMSQIFTQASKVNKILGIDVYDEATGKQRDFIDVMFDMQEAMKNMTVEAKLVALKDIVGDIGAKALIPLLGIAKEEVMKLRTEIEQGSVSAAGFADIVRATPVGKWEMMKSAISGVTMIIGENLLPIGVKLIETITAIAGGFKKFMDANPILIKVGLVVMAVGGALLIVGGALAIAAGMTGLMVTGMINLAVGLGLGTAGSITFTAALWGVVSALWSVIAPFLPIIGAVALLYFAFKSNFLGIRDTVAAFSVAMSALWAWIKPVFIGIKTLVVDVVGKLIKTVTGWFIDWNSQFEGGRAPLLRLAGTIAYAIGFIVGIFQRLFGFFKEHKILGGALLAVFAGSALGVMKYVKASGSLISALKGLPHALRLGADSMKFLAARMREFDPATIGPKLKSAFTTGAASVRTGVSNIIGFLGRGLKSAWAFSTGMVKSTLRWSGEIVRATLRVGKGLAQLGLQFMKAAGNVVVYGAKMIWAGVQATGQMVKGLALTTVSLLRQGVAFVATRVAMLAGTVVQNIMTASTWAMNVAMSANPIGLIIIGVVALIGVIILLVKHWDKVWGAIKTGVGWIGDALKWLAGFVEPVFKAVFKAIVWPFKMAWNVIKSLFGSGEGPFGGFLGTVVKIFGAVFRIITLPFQIALAVIKTIFGGGEGEGFFTRLISNIAGIFTPVINLLSGPFKFAWKIIKAVFSPVVNFFKGISDAVGKVFKGVIGLIAAPFKLAINAVKGAIGGLVSGVGGAVKGIGGLISGGMSKAWMGAKSAFSGAVGFFKGIFTKSGESAGAGGNIITSTMASAWGKVKDVFGGAGGFIKDFWENLKTDPAEAGAMMGNLISAGMEKIKGIFEGAKGFFKGVWTGFAAGSPEMAAKISGIFTGVKGSVVGIFTGLIGFFQLLWDKITSIFGGVFAAIKGVFTGILTGIKSALFGFVNFFIDTINKAIGLASKIPGVNIPLIPRLEIAEPPEMKPAELGVELKEFTKSENLISASPWTVKTADADLKMGIEEAEEPKLPLMKAIIEPIFEVIPVITVFARAVLLEPLERLLGAGPEVAMAGGFTLPSPVGGAGIATPPTGGESYSTSRTVVDRRVGPIHININGGDPRNVRRELENFFEQMASQGNAIENVEFG